MTSSTDSSAKRRVNADLSATESALDLEVIERLKSWCYV
jgi:hypothetical protein